MKKKNWLFGLLLLVVVFSSMFLLSACGDEEPKMTGISVFIDDKIVAIDNKTVTIEYGEIDDISIFKNLIEVRLYFDNGDYDILNSSSTNYNLTGVPSVFNAGTYPITVTYGNFDAVTVDLVIEKASIDMINTEWYYNGPIDYNGSEITIELSGVPMGVSEVLVGNKATNAGNYTASASFRYDTTNYKLINNSVQNLSWTISKITPASPIAKIGASGEKLSTITLPEGWSWDNGDINLSQSGNYKASFSGSQNYIAVSSTDIYVTVKENPTLSSQTNITANYGDTLEDVSFNTSNSDTPGTWAWVLPTTTSVGNAGTNTFKATFTPTDTSIYASIEKDIQITVQPKKLAKPTVVPEFIYDGNLKSVIDTGFDATLMTRSGCLGFVEVSTSYVYYNIIDKLNYTWEDGTVEQVVCTWSILPKPITKPTSTALTYTGNLQTANITTSDYYTITDNTGTDAGSYNAKIKLNDYNYAWADDNTNEEYILPWVINKAEFTFSAKNLSAFNSSYTKSKYYIGFDKDNFTYESAKFDISCSSEISNDTKNSIIDSLNLTIGDPYYFWYEDNVRKTTNLTPNNTELKLCVPISVGTINNNIDITNMNNDNQVLLDYVGTIEKNTPVIDTNPSAVTIYNGNTLTDSLIINGVVKAQLANSLDSKTTSLLEVSGSWAWKTQNTIPTESGNHIAVFTPTDINCFNTIEASIVVTVDDTPEQVSAPTNLKITPNFNGGYIVSWQNTEDTAQVKYSIEVDTDNDDYSDNNITTTSKTISNNLTGTFNTIKVKAVPTDTNKYSESDWSTLSIGTTQYNTLVNKLFGLKTYFRLELKETIKDGVDINDYVVYKVNNEQEVCYDTTQNLYHFMNNDKTIVYNGTNSYIGDVLWADYFGQHLPIMFLSGDIGSKLFDASTVNQITSYQAKSYTGETDIRFCYSTQNGDNTLYEVWFESGEGTKIEHLTIIINQNKIVSIENNYISEISSLEHKNLWEITYTTDLLKPSNWADALLRKEVSVVNGTLTSDYEGNITKTGNVYEVISGDKITLSPIIPDGKTFSKWTFGTNSENTTANYEYIVKNDITFTANFIDNQSEAQGLLTILDFGEISGLNDQTFNHWTVSNKQVYLKDADLTEAQFNGIIAKLNEKFNTDGTQLPSWSQGKELYDNTNPISSLVELGLTNADYGYNCVNYNEGETKFQIIVSAYQKEGLGLIHLHFAQVYIAENEYRIKYINDLNSEDTLIVMLNNDQSSGNVSWGSLEGTFTFVGPQTLSVSFDDSTTTTVTLNEENGTISFNHNDIDYNFTEEDLILGLDITPDTELKFYDLYNTYKTNGKFRVSFEDYDEDTRIIVTCTEWSEGEGNDKIDYSSMKMEMYAKPENQGDPFVLVSTNETIYDMTNIDTNGNVYFYYSSGSENLYKVLPINDFFTLIQGIDNKLTSIKQLYETSQFSIFCFGLLNEDSTYTLTREELTQLYCTTGAIKVEDEWYTIEGYYSYQGYNVDYLLSEENSILIPFEGNTYLIPDLTFSDYPTVGERENYIAWDQTSFESLMQNIYGSDSGGQSEGSEQVYQSENSDLLLIINPDSYTSGRFSWGELHGSYVLSEQNNPSAVANITITPEDESEFTGTIDRESDVITFNYESVDYVFSRTNSGGGDASIKDIFQDYNLPTNFQAVWTDNSSLTHTLTKVGDDFHCSMFASFMQSPIKYFYQKQSDGLYAKYFFNNEVWEQQDINLSIKSVENSIDTNAFFNNYNDLTNYSQGTNQAYESFEDCRYFELENESIVYLHSEYDFVVARYNGNPTDILVISLESIDLSNSTFADYGISDLPN